MDNYITRPEHEEFAKRMEEEHRRQNRRIRLLEENVLEIGELTTTVAKLAISMENVIKVQEKQGKRLEALEEVPGRSWDTLKYGIIGAAAAAVGSGIIAAVINFM